MATKIIYDYDAMTTVVNNLNSYAGELESAATTFKQEMESATANWEGASKDAFIALIEGEIYSFMYKSYPEMIKGAAKVLDSNIKTMSEADTEIAKNIKA